MEIKVCPNIKNLDRKMKKLYKAIKKLEIIDTNSPILIKEEE